MGKKKIFITLLVMINGYAHATPYQPVVNTSDELSNSQNATVVAARPIYKIGEPYVIDGVTFLPKVDYTYDAIGFASWYGDDFHGKLTANGEIFDKNQVTAAHPTLPLPSFVEVTNLQNNKKIIVRVNDRGPYIGGREIDLSYRASELLGFKDKGLTRVRVRILPKESMQVASEMKAQSTTAKNTPNTNIVKDTVAPEFVPVATYKANYNTTPEPTDFKKQENVSDLSSLNVEPDNVNPYEVPVFAKEDISQANQLANSNPEYTGDMQTKNQPQNVYAVEKQQPQMSNSINNNKKVAVAPPVDKVEIYNTGHPKGIYVQVAAYSSRDSMEQAAAQIGMIGTITLSSVDVSGKTYYRVRVGPFDDVKTAKKLSADLNKNGYNGSKVIIEN